MEKPQKTQNVTARIIIEMLGTPKAHVEKTLRDYVAALREDKNIVVLAEHMAEAEERERLFSAFVELDLRFPGVDKLMDFCFESMPSSVEILEPTTLVFDSKPLTDLLNDLQTRLHQVDMAIKQLTAQNTVVDKNATNVLHNFILHLLKDGGKTADELAPLIGIHRNQLTAFLEKMIEMGKIKLHGDKYTKP